MQRTFNFILKAMGISYQENYAKKDQSTRYTEAGRYQRQENQVYYHTFMSENDRG